VTCAEFDRWLDEGRPRATLQAMSAHAAGCARCMRALAASLELDAALAAPSRVQARAAPAGFTERVMRRVSVTPQVSSAPAAAWLAEKARTAPLWLRVLSEPAVALALAAAALLAWRGPTLFTTAPGALAAIAGAITNLSGSLKLPLAQPMPQALPLALMIAALPPLLWLGWRLLSASEAATLRAARRG
jgi:hypothetical protein